MRDFRPVLVALPALYIAFAVAASAQSAAQVPTKVATKFDEYGNLRGCDHSARLDNLAVQLQNMEGSRAFIAAYAPQRNAELVLDRIREYLVNIRGIVAERIETYYAGRNDVLSEPRIQLWVVPAGEPNPKLPKFKPNVGSFQGLLSEHDAYDSGDFEREEVPIFEDAGTDQKRRIKC